MLTSVSAVSAMTVTDQLARVVAELPGGQVRPGQQAMAEAVAQCLSALKPEQDAPGAVQRVDPCHVAVAAVAAGTGTGKSFAYLVPAVLSRKCVVVATATKALQDQLATKDLPLLARAMKLGRPLRWAVLKGRGNYVCRQRLAEIEQAGRQAHLEGLDETGARGGARASLADEVARLVRWSQKTESGDRAELDFEPHRTAWSAVSVGSDECPGAHRCPSGSDCFAERARTKAEEADVVVVNLHLLGADLRSGGAVLPPHGALIVDEAHQLEDVVAECVGADVSPGRIRRLASAARQALDVAGGAGSNAPRRAARGTVPDQPDSPAGPVEALLKAAARFEAVLATSPDRRLPPGLGDDIGGAVALVVSCLAQLERELRRSSSSADPPGSSASVDASQRALRALLAVERCREELESCVSAGRSSFDEVVWVTGGEHQSLRSAPLDVSSLLSRQLFAEMPVVLTSATLAPGLARRLGASPDRVTELDVGSPFDYANHGLLYCAVQLPDRRQAGWEDAVHDELEALIVAAGGRTLALFTSYRAMEAAAAELKDRVPWPVHVQGDLPKPALLRAFSSEDSACLFATMGFWQGVDVPGPTLSLVVIDRLPFPRPDEPLLAARREAAGAMGFRVVDLPRAATLLAQGAGRLIRTETDRGVVAVLDRRLATAGYSGYFVKALPPMRRTRDRAEALAFLDAIRLDGAQPPIAQPPIAQPPSAQPPSAQPPGKRSRGRATA